MDYKRRNAVTFDDNFNCRRECNVSQETINNSTDNLTQHERAKAKTQK